jgi:hypothetical protein
MLHIHNNKYNIILHHQPDINMPLHRPWLHCVRQGLRPSAAAKAKVAAVASPGLPAKALVKAD